MGGEGRGVRGSDEMERRLGEVKGGKIRWGLCDGSGGCER